MAKLVTGGTGFIGAELVHILVDRGEDVVVFDRTIKHNRIDDIEHKVKVVQGDLGNWSAVFNVIKDNKITDIYHQGSMLTIASQGNPWSSFQANVVGTYNVLEAARLFDVEKVMFASTLGTYSLEIGAKITDTTIQRPTTIYGIGKLYCEGLGRFYRTNFGLDFRSIRYPGVVGPGIRTPGHWCPPMIENAVLGKPYECFVTEDTTMPMILVKDAARAADMILQAPKENIKMVNYNVAGGASVVSAKEVEQAIKKYIPDAVITYKPNPAVMESMKIASMIKVFDDSYARKEWSWKPVYVTVDQVVSTFIEEMKAHPQRYGMR
jgi:threonine 3-dehydrogenase